VLNKDGEPIPGLFAVGELAGFGGINGWAGLEGTFLGPSIVTGRVAAQTALASMSLPAPEQPEAAPEPPSDPAVASFGNDACTSCHALEALVTLDRPGYRHFEVSHRVVLDRSLQCRDCHAGMDPYRVDAHTTDRWLESTTCAHCHLARAH
jgi:hypothetical protein